MVVDIELTRRATDRYVARALQFPDVTVEAASRDDALSQIRAALTARQRTDTEIVQITVDLTAAGEPAAWPRHAGAFPDDDAYQTMLAEIARERRAMDADA